MISDNLSQEGDYTILSVKNIIILTAICRTYIWTKNIQNLKELKTKRLFCPEEAEPEAEVPAARVVVAIGTPHVPRIDVPAPAPDDAEGARSN